MGLKSYLQKRRARRKEQHADEQYLDALEIIKESTNMYLNLLAQTLESERTGKNSSQPGSWSQSETIKRLEKKLNANFEYSVKNWNGEIKITHTINSNCFVNNGSSRLGISDNI